MKVLVATMFVSLAVGNATAFADWPVNRILYDDAPAAHAPKALQAPPAGVDEDGSVVISHHAHGGCYSGCADGCGGGYVPTYGRWHHRIRGFGGFETNWSTPWWQDCDHCGGQEHSQESESLEAKPIPKQPAPAPAETEKSTRRMYGRNL